MGLIGSLLGLPLAPVRDVVWLAERLQEMAAQELNEPAAVQSALQEAEEEHAAGRMSDEEFETVEATLVNRLLAMNEEERARREAFLLEEDS